MKGIDTCHSLLLILLVIAVLSVIGLQTLCIFFFFFRSFIIFQQLFYFIVGGPRVLQFVFLPYCENDSSLLARVPVSCQTPVSGYASHLSQSCFMSLSLSIYISGDDEKTKEKKSLMPQG